MAASEENRVGKFHPRCGRNIELSHEKTVTTGKDYAVDSFAFSNDQIPIGLQFSDQYILQTSRVRCALQVLCM